MPKRDRADYMREYRARTKKVEKFDEWNGVATYSREDTFRAEITRLTEEVARLKRELAARPDTKLRLVRDSFTEFRPVPKPGRK